MNGIPGTQGRNGTDEYCIFFASDQSIGNEDYMSQGSSSASLIRNTLVVPQDSIIISITGSIRENTNNTNIGFQVVESVDGAPVVTGVNAFIPDGMTSTFGFGTGSYPVQMGDLITVQSNFDGGALANGATATVCFQRV